MLLEEQRSIAEDLERLEQGIADRMDEEPKLVGFPSPSPFVAARLCLKLTCALLCRSEIV